MFKRAARYLTAWCSLIGSPAEAHVKWFLSESESKLLLLPKPDLFTHVRWDNGLAAVAVSVLLIIAHGLNKRFADHAYNRALARASAACDRYIQLVIGAFTGILLIACWHNMTFFVPNLHLHNCCRWIAQSQGYIGIALLTGFLTRPAAAAMLFLLLYSLFKFPISDCVDLLPMYGIAIYLLIAGRGKYSFDRLLSIDGHDSTERLVAATAVLRVFVGIGLAVLGLDEKLIHPQLALNLLQQFPQLNLLAVAGCGNDMFVLLAGLVEFALGIALACGIFPRLIIAVLCLLFTATTLVFGTAEFVGHLPYCAVFAAIMLRGANGSVTWKVPRLVSLRPRPRAALAALTLAKP
jgi:uncharacterized membrane protein YphA (DoxX/SURF4 family)